MKLFIAFLLNLILFFANNNVSAQASLKCLQLEGLNIGCIPATNHPCFRTVAKNVQELGEPPAGNVQRNCFYIQRLRLNLRQDTGPIAMNCIALRPNPDCNPRENPNCSTSICDRYATPTCNEVCKPCAPEIKFLEASIENAGCTIISDGSGGCAGPSCRKRCGDEPYAGGIKHDSCCDGLMCPSGCSGLPFVACKSPSPLCLEIHPIFSDFKNIKEAPPECSSLQGCPRAVDFRGNGINWPPPGIVGDPNNFCMSDSGVVPRNPADGFCPLGSRPITGVQINSETCSTENQEFEGTGASPGVTCPWVKAFGQIRTNCEPIPECCQFNPATRTSPAAGAEGRCPVASGGKDSCQLWLDSQGAAAGATTNSIRTNSTPIRSIKKGK